MISSLKTLAISLAISRANLLSLSTTEIMINSVSLLLVTLTLSLNSFSVISRFKLLITLDKILLLLIISR